MEGLFAYRQPRHGFFWIESYTAGRIDPGACVAAGRKDRSQTIRSHLSCARALEADAENPRKRHLAGAKREPRAYEHLPGTRRSQKR